MTWITTIRSQELTELIELVYERFRNTNGNYQTKYEIHYEIFRNASLLLFKYRFEYFSVFFRIVNYISYCFVLKFIFRAPIPYSKHLGTK